LSTKLSFHYCFTRSSVYRSMLLMQTIYFTFKVISPSCGRTGDSRISLGQEWGLKYGQLCTGVQRGGAMGDKFPRRRITALGAEKPQQCHKYFLQYSTLAFERPQVRTWGAPNRLLAPGAI